MEREFEDTLTRELHQVAQRVAIPPLPELPDVRSRRSLWQPMLVAAVAVLIALAVVATTTNVGDDGRIVPAPSPSPTQAEQGISKAAPSIPYVVGEALYVGGEQVPGTWAFVEGSDNSWVGGKLDGSYWWGTDASPNRFEGGLQQPPALSPDGSFRAWVAGAKGALRAVETTGGSELNGPAVGVLDSSGVLPWVSAVTDDDLVVAQGGERSFLWRPLDDGTAVDLADSAPGQTVVDSTVAGLVVVDGGSDAREGSVYLGTIDRAGVITRGQDLPNHDVLAASTAWLAWVEVEALGYETGTAATVQTSRLDGSEAGVLTAPEGFQFRGFALRWEDEAHLVAAVVGDGGANEMVRCNPETSECVVLNGP